MQAKRLHCIKKHCERSDLDGAGSDVTSGFPVEQHERISREADMRFRADRIERIPEYNGGEQEFSRTFFGVDSTTAGMATSISVFAIRMNDSIPCRTHYIRFAGLY